MTLSYPTSISSTKTAAPTHPLAMLPCNALFRHDVSLRRCGYRIGGGERIRRRAPARSECRADFISFAD
jgi:hypothetical protein